MSDDIAEAVETFLDDSQTVLGEYEQGYMDADATLSILEGHIADLREEFEG